MIQRSLLIRRDGESEEQLLYKTGFYKNTSILPIEKVHFPIPALIFLRRR